MASDEEAKPSDKPGDKADRKAVVAMMPKDMKPPIDFDYMKASYVVHTPSGRVGVWLGRRTFYVYKAQAADGVKLNAQGGASISFRQDIAKALAKVKAALGELDVHVSVVHGG